MGYRERDPQETLIGFWGVGEADHMAVRVLVITMASWWLNNSCATAQGAKGIYVTFRIYGES